MAGWFESSARSWIAGIALAAPLVLVTVWLAQHALKTPPGSDARPAAASSPPGLDLPADRLEERVNGAAEALRAAGCTRLLHWRSESPPADVEAFVFATTGQAQQALTREAGTARTAGPGDEAAVSEQTVAFRRGAILVRAYADPGAPGGPRLLELASSVDAQVARLQ